jgi:hypothetical protein
MGTGRFLVLSLASEEQTRADTQVRPYDLTSYDKPG